MGLLQISVVAIVAVVACLPTTYACYGYYCGCIYNDNTVIDKKDLVHEQLRSQEFYNFANALYSSLKYHWIALVYIKTTFYNEAPKIAESGQSLCSTTSKPILGYWKDDGETLCWIVAPEIYQAECCGESCCGPNTRCEPSVYLNQKYLVYCDSYYDYAKPPSVNRITESTEAAAELDEEAMAAISQEEGSGEGTGRKRDYGSGYGYFAFRHDPFPLSCQCKTCDW